MKILIKLGEIFDKTKGILSYILFCICTLYGAYKLIFTVYDKLFDFIWEKLN